MADKPNPYGPYDFNVRREIRDMILLFLAFVFFTMCLFDLRDYNYPEQNVTLTKEK